MNYSLFYFISFVLEITELEIMEIVPDLNFQHIRKINLFNFFFYYYIFSRFVIISLVYNQTSDFVTLKIDFAESNHIQFD